MMSSSASVLIVCLANACRSPLAAALLLDRLGAAAPAMPLKVGSAGVAVVRGGARCEWSLSKDPRASSAGPVTARSKRDVGTAPRAATRADLARATLILGADRSVVSELIRLAPAERERMFTLKEAAALARLAVADTGDGFPRLRESTTTHVRHRDLAQLVADMDGSRGWLPVEHHNHSRRFGRSRSWSTTLDVPDAHSAGERVQHPTMFRELSTAIDALAASLALVSPCAGTAG